MSVRVRQEEQKMLRQDMTSEFQRAGTYLATVPEDYDRQIRNAAGLLLARIIEIEGGDFLTAEPRTDYQDAAQGLARLIPHGAYSRPWPTAAA
jgi:hypothetical protein